MPKTKSHVLTARTAAADFDGGFKMMKRRDPAFVPDPELGQTPVDAPVVDYRVCMVNLGVDGADRAEAVSFPIGDALTSGEQAQLDTLLGKLLEHAADEAGFSDA
jgi:hypothetical protein